MLESTTVDLLRAVGLGNRLDAEGLEHDGIYLQFLGERHFMDFRKLTNGRSITVYAQTEIVKDLIKAHTANGSAIEFGVTDTEVDRLNTDKPILRYTDSNGVRHEVTCDAIAGCDGFHGICRPAMSAISAATTIAERSYPYAWLGILAQVPPSTDQVIYSRHERGFALHSMRTPDISRLYIQVPADEAITNWPDDRIWEELSVRLGTSGWKLHTGPVLTKNIAPMRSFVMSSMRHRRLFLAGDAAHIVPPTGAKGLNLAIADVTVLATALIGLLRDKQPELADAYSRTCLERVWRATYLSWWMTTMLHVAPGNNSFETGLQVTQLQNLVTSEAAAAALAEMYTGYAPLHFDPSVRSSHTATNQLKPKASPLLGRK
jgi:p-hydroxybenzoate 3-monooxygenase